MAQKEISNHTYLLIILSLLLTGMIFTGLADSGISATAKGFLKIQTHPARLINDYIEIAGTGGALLNGALVGAIGLLLILVSRIPLSGPTFAAVLTMAGFGLFGKTPLNILPIFFGVYLSARLVGKGLRDYLMIALFGTALAPLVSTLAWELGLPPLAAVLAGTAGGIVTGFFLPAIAVSMLHLHQGYNLYNMGLTCGFFGLFAAALLRGFGHEYAGAFYWFEGTNPYLSLLVPAMSLLLIAAGIVRDGRKVWKALREILTIPGRLPSDFIDLVSAGGTLLNSGLIGLAGSLYIYLIGAPFNGSVIGGLLTIMGFGAFGTHISNAWPVVTGVILATLATGNSLNSPGPVLAAIFSTTLAPLAGEFGIPAGVAAGIIHLLMVLQTGAWHGGMNLYNNGFAGGLTASLIIAVIQWYRTNKEEF
ncbi:DUF1576 domain-containing protein [Spirochaeta isovalerica]|uniref:DUF1576 domain-containing protein n=1 Tax=Spirochaeta isovalerica TaxID=150 RepID=A0A841RDA2_9SPIO|nr:DUF1576 domain-containing protein [Spirochaeta isovalerica]MBB6480970.1 hypothetical protein [Spirochaeta isovalerica]